MQVSKAETRDMGLAVRYSFQILLPFGHIQYLKGNLVFLRYTVRDCLRNPIKKKIAIYFLHLIEVYGVHISSVFKDGWNTFS